LKRLTEREADAFRRDGVPFPPRARDAAGLAAPRGARLAEAAEA
jgi:hypothetical protein